MAHDDTPEADRQDYFANLGGSGLVQHGGVLGEEFLRELSGSRAYKTWREMGDNAAPVSAGLATLRLLMREVEWDSVPADEEDPTSVERAEWLDGVLDDMESTWDDVVDDALTKLQFGFSPLEIVLKERNGEQADPPSRFDDGLIGIHSLELRGQDTVKRWHFDDAGRVTGMTQRLPDGREPTIPIGKLLLFRTERGKGNPQGRPILRGAYTAWVTWKRIQMFEAIGIERDLVGVPKLGVPPELFTDSDKQSQLSQWKEVATRLRAGEQSGVVYPLDYERDQEGNAIAGAPRFDVGLFESPGSGKVDTGPVIERNVLYMLQAMLVDVIQLGHEQVGTQALALERRDLLNAGLNAYLGEIAENVNRKLLPLLWRMNGWEPETQATLVPGKVRRVDIGELAQAVWRLSQAGLAFDDTDTQQAIRSEAGLPQPDPDDLDADPALDDTVEGG